MKLFLVCYDGGTAIYSDSLGPELRRFQDGAWKDPFELSHKAARHLREEAGLNLEAVRGALVANLHGRLNDLSGGLAYIEENLTNSEPRRRDQSDARRAG